MVRPTSKTFAASVRTIGPLTVRVSDAADDKAWDDFLRTAPTAHYAQTSAWGRGRAYIGWHPVRVVISDGDRVVAGAQMVTRPMPAGGRLGFVCRGPVLAAESPDLAALVYDELMALGRADGVQYLVVQPPRGCHGMTADLERRGFRYGAFDIDFTATVLVDLSREPDAMFASLEKKCRQHIRQAEKRGVTVRRGTREDLAIFNRVKDVHSARLGYERRAAGYYECVWDALTPRWQMEMFVAEKDGEPITAQLVLPFGDTSHHMEAPWSGEHADLHPNELLQWEAMLWAKAAGYRYADFGGIERPLGEALLEGRRPDDAGAYSQSMFKLKFGGDVVLDPPASDYVYNGALRLAYHTVPVRVMRAPATRKLLFKFRETGS